MDYSKILDEIRLGGRYVFYSSLLEEESSELRKIGQSAQTSLSTWKQTELSQSSANSKINIALEFLQKAASFERSKEIRFLENYKAMYPEAAKELNLNNGDLSFIINLNQMLKGAEAFKKEFNMEYDRIQRARKADEIKGNRSLSRLSKKMTEDYWNALSDNGTKTSALSDDEYYLKFNGKTAFNTLISDQSNISTLTDFIMEKYGGKLLMLVGDKLHTSQSFAAMIKVLIDKAYQMLISQYGKVASKETQYELNISQAQSIIEQSEFMNFVDQLINSPTLEVSMLDIAEQHGMSTTTKEKIKGYTAKEERLKSLITKGANQIFKQPEEFAKWQRAHRKEFNYQDLITNIYTVSAQGYYTGEDTSLTNLLAAQIGAMLGGRNNPTDDIEAGKLIINYDITLNPNAISILKTQEQKLLQAQREAFSRVQRTTNLDSFEQNTEQLRQLRIQQQEIINQAKQELSQYENGLTYLKEHINIHLTVKGYKSAGRDSFREYEGFEGAAFGSTLSEQVKIISHAAESGGLSLDDINWLIFAMRNAGDGMIGQGNKRSIEDYFSVFVGFFMFNDAELMIQDVYNSINNEIEGNINDLHVYQLNGIFIPSSYLLQKTYDSLSQVAADIAHEAAQGQGTKAILHTYDKGPRRGDWPGTEAQAEKDTKLEMKFLGGFLDLLNSIYNAINM